MFCPHSRERDYTRTQIPGGRDHRGPSEKLSLTQHLPDFQGTVLTLPLRNSVQRCPNGPRLVLRMEKLTSPSPTQPFSSSGLADPGRALGFPSQTPVHTGESLETLLFSAHSPGFLTGERPGGGNTWHSLSEWLGTGVRPGFEHKSCLASAAVQ